jgi:hypothetical protein
MLLYIYGFILKKAFRWSFFHHNFSKRFSVCVCFTETTKWRRLNLPLILSLMETNNEIRVFILKMLMCAESVGVKLLCEEQNVITLTIQILTSMKNCASA